MTAGGEPRRWWIAAGPTLVEGGRYRVTIQFADGATIAPVLEPADDLGPAISAAAEAHLRGDRRWTKRSERG